jgi:Protein of unknown function (Porph_ging).
MRESFLIAFLLVFALKLTAQQDSTYLKVTYRADCTLAFDSKRQVNDRMCLRIGTHSSVFFSETAAHYEHIVDSLAAKGYSFGQLMGELQKYPKSMQKYYVLKHYPDMKSLTFADKLISYRFVYSEQMQIPQWTILAEKKEIAGYPCQKAEAQFYGRKWEAWFASDIPVQDGPWKLCGLPGIILAAQDSAREFIYTCISIEKTERGSVIGMPKKNYQKLTKSKFIEMEKMASVDSDEFLFRMTGQHLKAYEADGRPMHRIHTYTPIER